MADPRKFGRAYLVDSPDLVLSHLGPEPLDKEFSADNFVSLMSNRKGALKPLLLNQSFIAGLGNIYVDEILWASKLHPLRNANTLSDKQMRDIYKNMKSILNAAISAHGTDFGDGVIHGGKYRPKVYGRADKKCSRCKSLILKMIVGSRGTHYCSGCQHLVEP